MTTPLEPKNSKQHPTPHTKPHTENSHQSITHETHETHETILSNEHQLRLEKRRQLIEKGEVPYVYDYNKTHTIHDIHTLAAPLQAAPTAQSEETLKITGTPVSLAGRLMAKRGHGKATFGNIKDDTGTIQYYGNINQLGEDRYAALLQLDIGDIIGITGTPFITQRGELSIKLSNVTLLTKSLRPLPEKYHGLQDKEQRYRHRYVDLIVNDDVKATFKTRSTIIQAIRAYLSGHDFIEVETPVLQSIYGGAAARPFKTHHNELGEDLYLRIALELPLKRLIVGGFERLFEIGRVFRNEGVSYKHNPEYTLLELYQAYSDYNDIMALTESLLSHLVHQQTGGYQINYQDKVLDFTPPFQRMTLNDALSQYAGVNMSTPIEKLRKKAKDHHLENADSALKGQLLNHIYDKCVEPNLIQPTFIMDYPWETSPLAKRKRDNPELVERFELIINAMEIANAFSELNDPVDQQERFDDQKKAKEAGDSEAHETDDDFIHALSYGMPPTGGLGIGIDRLVMLLTNTHSIRDVLFFPHMKRLDHR